MDTNKEPHKRHGKIFLLIILLILVAGAAGDALENHNHDYNVNKKAAATAQQKGAVVKTTTATNSAGQKVTSTQYSNGQVRVSAPQPTNNSQSVSNKPQVISAGAGAATK